MSIRGHPVSNARRLWVVFAAAVFVHSASPAAAAKVRVAVERRADAVVIEASAQLKTDAATAWQVLTDYDRYGDFIPGVRSSHVIARHGTTVTVDQSSDLAFWLLRLPVHVVYEIVEFPPNRLQSSATASALPTLKSTYALTAADQGVRLDYVGRVALGFALFRRIGQQAVEQNLVRQFQALADEIERQRVAAADASPLASH